MDFALMIQHAAKQPVRSLPPCKMGLLTEEHMRTRFGIALVVMLAAAQIGCIFPIYSSSPDVRARQLIFASESYRHVPEIWERIWGLDMPDVATPYRTHGGVI